MSLRALVNGLRATTQRHFTSELCSSARFSTTVPRLKSKEVKVTLVLAATGKRIETHGKVGDSLLDVVVDQDLPIEGYGACEGTLTCSTCHVIFKPEDFKKIENKPLDEEQDMLELAYGLTKTSRLGCQILLTPEMDGIEIQVPEGINDQRS